MSKTIFLFGVGLALVALALAITDWALSLQPGVTEANVKRIRPGMTVQEVEAVFGAPGAPSVWKPSPFAPYELFWAGECGIVCICFDLATHPPGYQFWACSLSQYLFGCGPPRLDRGCPDHLKPKEGRGGPVRLPAPGCNPVPI